MEHLAHIRTHFYLSLISIAEFSNTPKMQCSSLNSQLPGPNNVKI